MSIADSLMPEVIEDSLHGLFGIHSLRTCFRLRWHMLHSQNIHFLVLVPQVLRKHIAERLCAAEDWQSLGWIVSVGGSHVNDS